MRIGIVGGVERSEYDYRDLADKAGHELDFHSGHLAGRGSDSLTDLVRRVQLLIVVTDVNSHGAVQLARKQARKYGVTLLLQRRCSPARFATLLDAYAQRAAMPLAAVGS
jgi:hypothetical protein